MTKLYRGSYIHELVYKSGESALSAIQIFNNPLIRFKSETFIVLMIIAWTYLLHAYYKRAGVDIRYSSMVNGRKRYDRTKNGALKNWELRRCLDCDGCPIDKDAANNLRLLIGLRDEIEHQMTTKIDDFLSAKFQACCLNFNKYIKQFFGEEFGLDRHLAFSLQFASIGEEQKTALERTEGLPQNIMAYITKFEGGLTQAEYDSPNYSYRLFFVPKLASNKGQADKVIEFIKPDSPLADKVNKEYAFVKETEKPKFLPGQIVALMKAKGYGFFTMGIHTDLWQSKDARNEKYNYGAWVVGKWHWYESWIKAVEDYCKREQQKQTAHAQAMKGGAS
jgi:hypothetical protein